jgi:hypothetical protein
VRETQSYCRRGVDDRHDSLGVLEDYGTERYVIRDKAEKGLSGSVSEQAVLPKVGLFEGDWIVGFDLGDTSGLEAGTCVWLHV